MNDRTQVIPKVVDQTQAMPKMTHEPPTDEMNVVELPLKSALIRGRVSEEKPRGTIYRGRTTDQTARHRASPVRSRRGVEQDVHQMLWLARICTTLVIGTWVFILYLVMTT